MPKIRAYAFARGNAQVQYSTNDTTWSKDKLQNFGDQLRGMVLREDDSEKEAVTAERSEEQAETVPDVEEKAPTEEDQKTNAEAEEDAQNDEVQTLLEESLQKIIY